MSIQSLSNTWDVLLLFVIPIGGGIPAGVLLAKSHGISWPYMTLLYFISDIILACVFEPLMWAVISAGKKSVFLTRVLEALKTSVKKSTVHYGSHLGPIALVMVAFGVDPMTGRAAAAASGHGFITGWALAITGDMLYYLLLMASTLWLNNLLGDGTWTTIIILALMMIVPPLLRKLREAIEARHARVS